MNGATPATSPPSSLTTGGAEEEIRPFRWPTPTDLYDYGLIGNLHTAALVSRFGSIDWACFPRFASPSVFARILDEERGGTQAIAPLEPANSRQQYRPSTNILETYFELADGRALRIVDFMPVARRPGGEGAPMILRIVSAAGGEVEVVARFHPRFDYGRRGGLIEKMPSGFVARSDGECVTYALGHARNQVLGDEVTSTIRVSPGHPYPFEIYWGAQRPVPESPQGLLEATERFWRGWAAGGWGHDRRAVLDLHPVVERSVLLLKLLSHADTGAFVAAPTTSLPEWPGGSRNWDYRYTWIRDTAFAVKALLTMGHVTEARSFLRWVLERTHREHGGILKVLYGAHGETDLAESELPHLAGFLGSRPVRVGNGAVDQFQLDIYGTVLNLVSLMAERESSRVLREWPHIAGLADEVVALWRKPDQGIWEVRGPPAHYVHSKLMAWVALDRSARLAVRFGTRDEHSRWESEAALVRTEILERGFDPETQSFRQAFDRPGVDAANLRIPLVGFLPFTDPRVQGTIDRVISELSHGPFVHRYRAPDGLEGPEGAFLLCSFWLVECLARSGRRAEALARWESLLAVASPLGLYAEEYDPVAEQALGNYPQAFTSIGVLRAALALAETRPGMLSPEARGLPIDR